jgi:general secretion pathway protein J
MSDRTAGYAIAEMLASLVILGMIGTMMISGITTGQRVWERMDASDIAAENVAGAQLLLRERIESAFPATRNDTVPPFADFEGKADSISFLGEARDSERPTALRRYRLALDTDGDLVLSGVSDVALNQAVPSEVLVLLRGVQEFDVAYYGPQPNGPSAWQLSWDRQAALPQLVRIRLQFEQGDRRAWPELLIKPMVTIDSLCVLNAANGRCRGRQ